jgi:hypothetical protein
MHSLQSGTLAGIGSFRCQECGYGVTLAAEDALPECPGCGGTKFMRAPLFSSPGFEGKHPHDAESTRPDWLAEVREELPAAGEYVAYDGGDRVVVIALTQEWTRIGRSLAADVHFDDPTVSRRHALIVRQADGVRVLDDRSLNGVFVNGERVEWSTLRDGDEILVGRHSLRFIDAQEAGARATASAPSGVQRIAS